VRFTEITEEVCLIVTVEQLKEEHNYTIKMEEKFMRVMSSLTKSKCEEGVQKSQKSNVHLYKWRI
jgi:hypothetical protein